MSLFTATAVTCPNCETEQAMDAVGSVNADRRPDLREEILRNDFQRMTCDRCGTVFRLDPRFTYLDIARGDWIASYPYQDLAHWGEAVEAARDVFESAYSEKAGPTAAEIGAGLTWRVVFGWSAVREKLLLRELELDDVALELTKLAIIRGGGAAQMDSGVELRLVGEDGTELVFAWIDAVTEEFKDLFGVNRDLYSQIAADRSPWGALGDRMAEGPFVDFQKTLYPAAADPAA